MVSKPHITAPAVQPQKTGIDWQGVALRAAITIACVAIASLLILEKGAPL